MVSIINGNAGYDAPTVTEDVIDTPYVMRVVLEYVVWTVAASRTMHVLRRRTFLAFEWCAYVAVVCFVDWRDLRTTHVLPRRTFLACEWY